MSNEYFAPRTFYAPNQYGGNEDYQKWVVTQAKLNEAFTLDRAPN